ncbi:MAG: galactose oxidase-like domain-containing protein, partial [Planctomycetota bacterium]
SLLTAYPRQHLLSNGVLFIAPCHRQSVAIRHKEDPPAPWLPRGDTGAYNNYPTSVLMPNTTPANLDTVLRMGGAYINSSPPTYFSRRLTQKCKASAPAAGCWPTGHTWSGQGSCAAINQMIEKRADCDAVILPDGSVFVVGGEDNTPGGKGFLLSAELFKGGVWSPDAFHESPHGWHGTALLLPSAKVLVAGGNWRTRDYEIYVPLYLASGMPRPAITTAPTEIKYGFEYDVFYNLDPSAAVTKVVLMRPGSVTHAFCYDQRYVQLELSDLPPVEGSIRFKAPWSYPGKANPPAGAVRAPLGYYMLFLVTGDGVPSVAHWVKLVP